MEESSKNLYMVEIAGLPMKLRSSHDEETVKQLAAMVDEKVKEALDIGKNVSFQNALLLAYLHIAEELIILKRTALGELDRIESRTQQLLTDLEDSPVARIRLDN